MTKMKFKIDGKPSGLEALRPRPAYDRIVSIVSKLKGGSLLTTCELIRRAKVGGAIVTRLSRELNDFRVAVGGQYFWGNRFTIAAARKELNEAK